MITCWSVKGGSGTTVVASVLAAEMARESSVGAVIADLNGDVATVLASKTDVDQPGLLQWLSSSTSVPSSAAHRLTIEVMAGLRLLPPGRTPVSEPTPDHAQLLVQAQRLAQSFSSQSFVVDAGVVASDVGQAAALEGAAKTSILVLRPCYLAVKRASTTAAKADGFVFVEEHGRSLDARDVEDVLGVKALASIKWDASVARLVDAGRMKSRLPRSLRPLQKLARDLIAPEDARRAS